MIRRSAWLASVLLLVAACSGQSTDSTDSEADAGSGTCEDPPCSDVFEPSDSGSPGPDSTVDDTTDDPNDASETDADSGPPSGESAHPLPLASNWNNTDGGFNPGWQIDQIENGHRLLLTYEFRTRYDGPNEEWKNQNKPILETLKNRGAPIALNWGNWVNHVEDRSESSTEEQWREAGRDIIREVQGKLSLMEQWYPEPPYVLMVTNNEGDQVVDVPGDGKEYVDRQAALFEGMRDAAGPWGAKFRFIGYMWGGQANINIESRKSSALAWDGTSARNYRARSVTDHTAYSTPVTAMNLVVKKAYYRMFSDSPHLEISTWWDGKSSVEPDRYRGMATWGLWVSRPQSIRDFASSTTTIEGQWPYFGKIVAAVDQIHENETLRGFWKYGRRVVNDDIEVFTHVIDTAQGDGTPDEGDVSEYIDDPEKLQRLETLRHHWYHLPTSEDPPDPAPETDERVEYPKEAEFGVWVQAKVRGEQPDRRWLLYGYAPRGTKENVEVTIPDYQSVTLDIPQKGVFAVVDEQEGGIVETIDPTDAEQF